MRSRATCRELITMRACCAVDDLITEMRLDYGRGLFEERMHESTLRRLKEYGNPASVPAILKYLEDIDYPDEPVFNWRPSAGPVWTALAACADKASVPLIKQTADSLLSDILRDRLYGIAREIEDKPQQPEHVDD